MTHQAPSPTLASGDNPLLARWDTPYGAPPFAAIRPEHFGPAFDTAFAEHRGEIAAIAEQAAAPTFANTIAALERSGRTLSRVSSAFFCLVGAHSERGDPRARARDRAPPRRPLGRDPHEPGAVRPNHGDRGRAAPGSTPSRRGCWSGTSSRSAAPAPGSTRRRAAGWPRSASGWRRSARSSASGCSPTSRAGRCRSTAKTDLAGLPEHLRAAAARGRAGARAGKPRGGDAVALQRRAVPGVLAPARPAREGVPRLDRPRRRRCRPTTPRSSPRWCGCAPRRRGCSAIRPGPTTGSTTPWRRRRRRPARCSTKVWAPARARALADRDAMQEMIRAEGGNFALAAWDWRYYAEKLRQRALRPRRGRDRALPAARPHDRGGVRDRAPAVRHHGDAARGRAGVASRTCGCGRSGPATGAISACSSATTSPGRPSAAAPGCRACATRRSSTARCGRWSST